jgi:tRNA pseudouridine55 synthase
VNYKEILNTGEGAILLLHKPLTWTSFQVVKRIKHFTKAKKVGHAGTLDPLATGLLILCTEKMTKQIESIQQLPKIYTGTFTIGSITDSYDLEKPVSNAMNYEHITAAEISNIAKQMTGEILQYPPIFSAIKQDGKPIYLKARKEEAIIVKPRQINIYAFEITFINLPIIGFKITCSAGTYIRSIAHDIGVTLGCGAHLSSLCREQIGDYKLENAYDFFI